jgi:hypothetical protein
VRYFDAASEQEKKANAASVKAIPFSALSAASAADPAMSPGAADGAGAVTGMFGWRSTGDDKAGASLLIADRSDDRPLLCQRDAFAQMAGAI